MEDEGVMVDEVAVVWSLRSLRGMKLLPLPMLLLPTRVYEICTLHHEFETVQNK